MDLAMCTVEADLDQSQSKQDEWTVANVKHEMPDTPPRSPPTFIQRTKTVPKNIHGLKIVFPVAMDDAMTTVVAKNEVHDGKVKIQPKPPQKMAIVASSGANGE